MTGRRFVFLCANGREREQIRRLGLFVAGFEHVDLLILESAERTVRGMRVHEWGITEAARADWRAERIGWELERRRIREERPQYRLEPYLDVIDRVTREQIDEALREEQPAADG